MKSIVRRTGPPCCALVLLTVLCPSAGASAPPGDWRPLFNGKDLTGWSVATGRGGPSAPTPPAPWTVEDGILTGGQGIGRGSLVTTEQFKDFDLDLDFQLAEHGTRCSPERTGPEQVNASIDKTCTYNSGVSFRTGYQVNIGRREAGEYIGIVVHRVSPKGLGRQHNVLWLDTGDEKFPNLRKRDAWNHLQITANGPHLTVTLNGRHICDVMDDPTDPAEAKWKEAGPISLQWPPASEAGGFAGYVKFRHIRIREL